ncbi:hypothetical protein FGADI_5879 [Fusarium gaditjirri]|uniref:Uncharacterized protein n=1 Tax=Fusarium gaditjirri TaxID=282569 RepID=A0A8H4T938_9HYPO|nr:hypothetical protein FGADI_5879 [Fusarium gaditjirri]
MDKLFSPAKTTVRYFDDVSPNVVNELYKDKRTPGCLSSVISVCNSKYFRRVWAAMEFIRSECVRMMISNYTYFPDLDDPAFLGQVFKAWKDEVRQHEKVHDLERKVRMGKNSVPWSLGTLIQAKLPKRMNFAMKHRQSVLGPALCVFNRMYPTDELLEDAVLACRLRLTMRNVVFLSPLEARQKVYKAESHAPSSRRDWYNLSLLCELSNLNNERDHFILRYTVHAWTKIQRDSRRELSRCIGRGNAMPYQHVDLSDEELERLQGAFLDFEIQRHHLAYDKLLLYQTELEEGMLLPIYDEMSFLEGHLEHDSIERSRQSIFCFIFQSYERLIRQFERQLELEMPRQTRETCYSELVLVERFHRRTRDEELRYIALLCLQGYVCLRIAEKYSHSDLRGFVLNSFMWFCKDGRNHIPDPDGRLAYGLERFTSKYYSNKDTAHEPWSRGRYFWDKSRMRGLQLKTMFLLVCCPP